ncbi:transposase IS3/IS911 family protein [mine drainage metagenome]|uniref:Transposase IS3/IS911 family protein n=1 Tax=mine drainage metagenome TaxID=410659 RepID=T1AKK5_9ZZZZ
MNENRRSYKSEEKLKIVIEGLSGSIQISELCKKYGIQSSRFYEWKNKLVKNGANVFDDRGRKNTSDQKIIEEQEKELERLKETIAEIVTENLQLKKNIGNFRGKT